MNLEQALKIVKDNGYIIIKPTEQQFEDITMCEECNGDYDCFYCSCNVCIAKEMGVIKYEY